MSTGLKWASFLTPDSLPADQKAEVVLSYLCLFVPKFQ